LIVACLVPAWFAAAPAAGGVFTAASAPADKPDKPTFFCFDFASPFDKGRLGAKTAKVFRGFVRRREYFVTMIEWDLEELLAEDAFRATYDSKIEPVLDHAAKRYDASVVVFGAVHRKGRGYRLKIKAARREGGEDRLVLDETHDADNVHHIPVIADKVLRTLADDPAPGDGPDNEAERRWAEGPNLLEDGTFEKGDPHPPGWDAYGKPTQHGAVSRVAGVKGRKGTVLRFEMGKEVAATYGTQYYSESMPCELGATYRFKVDCATAGPNMKVFIKCYDEVTDPETGQTQLREVYRKQHDCHPKKGGGWSEEVTTFTPRLTVNMKGRSVKSMRVMLYAFHPAGACWWDSAVMKKIGDAKPVEEYDPGKK
jgi:hypothetical protein